MGTPEAIDRGRALLTGAERIAVLTGAGISTDSGIPDFRGPNGLWTRDPKAERLTNLHDYLASREVRELAWRARGTHPAWHAEPNAAHRSLVPLEAGGRLLGILTQNIDGLHQKAGSAPDLVLELHGTMFRTECLDCGDNGDMRDALARVAAGEPDPPCVRCGGIIKSATVAFGQALNPAVLGRARDIAVNCQVMLVVGSSLGVHPAAGLVGVAAQAGAEVIICNGSPTPYDELATVVIRDPIGTVLPALLGAAG